MTPMLSVTQDQTALRRVSAPGQLARQKRQTETAIRRGEFLPYLQCIVDAHSQYVYTVDDFCGDHPVGTYILAIDGHVVCVQDGFYWDTWDSGQEIPIYYWER